MFSVVIPVYPPDFQYLPRIINNIALSTNSATLVKECIISASECTEEYSTQLYSSLYNVISFPLIIHPTVEKQNAAQNRNRGWNIAKGEYICFMDSDDFFHPLRFAILAKIIKTNPNVKGIVHDYHTGYLHNWNPISIETIESKTILSPTIYKCTFPEGTRNAESETQDSGKTNIHVLSYDIQHGQATIRRDIYPGIQYKEMMRYGEDGRLLRDILWEYPDDGLIYICEKLTLYTY